MTPSTESFYDDLAESYHLLFEDWDRSITRQAGILGPLLERYTGKTTPTVLDCACGIGTQSLGLARRGYTVVASDLSGSAIERARREARSRGLHIDLHVADMRDLHPIPARTFDAVLAADNALPHLLSQGDLEQAIAAMAAHLAPHGVLVATLRDYDRLLLTRPATQSPAFFAEHTGYRIVHQVWHWEDTEYAVHLYITRPASPGWTVQHFHSRYRALVRADLNAALQSAGLAYIEWLDEDVTGFYQPIVIASRSAAAASQSQG